MTPLQALFESRQLFGSSQPWGHLIPDLWAGSEIGLKMTDLEMFYRSILQFSVRKPVHL